MESIIIELIKIIPSVLWLLFVVALVIFLYRPIKEDILPRLSSFEAAGVKFSVIRQSIQAAVELADELASANDLKSEKWNITVEPEAAEKAENRAKANIRVLRDSSLLWVDDRPDFNHNERKMFKQLGIEIDIATTTEQALTILQNTKYDVIISDIARGDDSQAGLTFLRELRNKEGYTKNLVFYIGRLDSDQVPEGAFGITNKPDELLHLTMDILERVKS